ncbi:MAG: RimK family alpha-L-glutamate ligase [Anaerolineales bacterium]|nr:RimK family alpha-L-glutamate ligase [Anaerolineales bacterium]
MHVLIFSRQANLYSTRRLVEVIENRGHEVQILDPITCPLHFDGSGIPSDSPNPDAVIPRIGASITAFGCAIVRRLEHKGVWVLNPSIGIMYSRDKLLSMQLLHSQSIPVPRTAVVSHPHRLLQAIQSVGGLPVVLKMRQGTQGRGVVLVRTYRAAQHAHAVLNDFQQYTLVQEYIAEAHNRDIRVIVVGEKVIAAMERKAPPGDFRANIHRGGSAKPLELDQQTQNLAIKAAKIHGLQFAGVDIIITQRGPAVMEVNSSPGLNGIEKTTGVDVADSVIQYIESEISKNRSDNFKLPEKTC